MNWAKVSAISYNAAGVANSATLTPKAGGTVRTYTSCKLNKTTQRVTREDGTVQFVPVQEVRIPRLAGATTPTVGELCSYNAADAFSVRSVGEEAGLWIVRSA